MTALPKPQSNYTLEEYAELEKDSEERLEFFEGNDLNFLKVMYGVWRARALNTKLLY